MTGLLALAVSAVAGPTLIMGSWLVLTLVMTGLGLLVRRRLGATDRPTLLDWWTNAWVGVVVSLGILQLWHLARPITPLATAVLGVLSVVGWMHAPRERIPDGLRTFVVGHPTSTLAIVLVAFWAANRCTAAVSLYDSGMYHIPAVEWAKQLAIVPGLGNLHGRLAFNGSSFLLAAAIDHGPLSNGASHVLNGWLLMLVLTEALVRGARCLRGEVFAVGDVMMCAWIPALITTLARDDAASLSTDLTVSLLLMATAVRFVEALGSPPDVVRRDGVARDILILLAGSIVIKLSAVVFAVVAGAMVVWRHVQGLEGSARLRAVTNLLVWPSILVLTWMGRGAVISGYLLYPSSLLSLPVSWRVPAEQVAAEAAWVVQSARHLNSRTYGVGLDWVGPWMLRIFSKDFLLLDVAAPVVLVAVALAWGSLLRRATGPRRAPWWYAVPVGASLAFWFVTAPHPRFGHALFWIGAGLAVAWAFERGRSSDRLAVPARWGLGVGVAITTVVLFSVQVRAKGPSHFEPYTWRWLASPVFVIPAPGVVLHPMPTARVSQFRSDYGVELQVPTNDNLCWNAALLCTPHPAPNIAFRHGAAVSGGFVARGPWRAQRFPNPVTPGFVEFLRCRQRAGSTGEPRACLRLAARPPALGSR